jgi:multiple antibiotic resistance protein
MLDWPHYVQLLVGLFILVDPLGAMPVFLSLTEGRTQSERIRVALIGILVMILTLTMFVFFGGRVLELFSISISSFQIAGGLFLVFVAFEMMLERSFTTTDHDRTSGSVYTVGIVPLGIPLLAGPGTISMVIVHGEKHPSFGHELTIIAVIVTMGIVTMSALMLAHRASANGSQFGQLGLTVINRLMGLIILSIAVDFIVTGFSNSFPGLL